jgi:hypothetical protein
LSDRNTQCACLPADRNLPVIRLEPLPQSVAFGGQQQGAWTPASGGSETFEDLAQWSANGLVLRRSDAGGLGKVMGWRCFGWV